MNPVALVTGGSRGIGRGIVERLLHAGYDVAVNGVRPATQVADVLGELRALGHGRVEYTPGDVGETSQRTEIVDSVRNHFGRLDVLVNNAGIAPAERVDLLDASEASFDRVLSTNLRGPYFLTQLVARWMVEQRQRHTDRRCAIVNVNSISATVASPNRGEYCLSKAALAMATQLWAARLAADGIPVYEVRPGLVQTDMTSAVQEKYDRLIASGALLEPRWGTPEDVGRAVCALVRGDLPYATGQVIVQDGGLTAPRL